LRSFRANIRFIVLDCSNDRSFWCKPKSKHSHIHKKLTLIAKYNIFFAQYLTLASIFSILALNEILKTDVD